MEKRIVISESNYNFEIFNKIIEEFLCIVERNGLLPTKYLQYITKHLPVILKYFEVDLEAIKKEDKIFRNSLDKLSDEERQEAINEYVIEIVENSFLDKQKSLIQLECLSALMLDIFKRDGGKVVYFKNN